MGALYMALAQELDLPVKLIQVEDHYLLAYVDSQVSFMDLEQKPIESIQFFMTIWFFGTLWLYGILLQIMFVQLDWIKSKSLRQLAQLLFCLIVACVILARMFFRIPLSLNHP